MGSAGVSGSLAPLARYEPYAGREAVEELRRLANRVAGKRFLHINSTRTGGGVAELLDRLVPLTNELGIPTRWEVIEGDERFFKVTKSFHNALQGMPVDLDQEDLDHYLAVNWRNAEQLDLFADTVLVHDPQPAPLIQTIKNRHPSTRVIWRAHIDLARADRRVMHFLTRFTSRADATLFHMPEFVQETGSPPVILRPSIDPLAEKNRELSPGEMREALERHGIPWPTNRFVVTQISRFDRWKDPVGVIRAFKEFRNRLPAGGRRPLLILAGGGAADDPEGAEVLREVLAAAGGDPDIVIKLLPHDPLAINALQRISDVVMQKSLAEGFGLTVSEALWKGKPVIGGNVGGIKAQIVHGENGFLVSSPGEAADALEFLFAHPSQRERMGRAGREMVREHYLVTRHVRDYLLLLTDEFSRGCAAHEGAPASIPETCALGREERVAAA